MTTKKRFSDVAKGPFRKDSLDSAIRAQAELLNFHVDADAEDNLARMYEDCMAGERRLPPDAPADLADYAMTFTPPFLYVALLAKHHLEMVGQQAGCDGAKISGVCVVHPRGCP